MLVRAVKSTSSKFQLGCQFQYNTTAYDLNPVAKELKQSIVI
jgi:hypothetical protein